MAKLPKNGGNGNRTVVSPSPSAFARVIAEMQVKPNWLERNGGKILARMATDRARTWPTQVFCAITDHGKPLGTAAGKVLAYLVEVGLITRKGWGEYRLTRKALNLVTAS